jgi:hypothetical protein
MMVFIKEPKAVGNVKKREHTGCITTFVYCDAVPDVVVNLLGYMALNAMGKQHIL